MIPAGAVWKRPMVVVINKFSAAQRDSRRAFKTTAAG